MSSMISKRRIFDALLREDFHAFVLWAFAAIFGEGQIKDNWHLKYMAEHLEDVFHGKRRRLLICLPPRHLKSIICSVCYPAWVLGRQPNAKLVCVSYAQNIAEGFAHQTRSLMGSPGYKRVFPKTRIDPRRSSKRDIGTTANGHRMATSVTGPLTALGGDYLIIDDPIKADDALSDVVRESVNNWYMSTATSRLDDPKTGRMIVVAQRLHVDDLPGRLIAAGDWDQIILPLISFEHTVHQARHVQIAQEPGAILHEDHIGEAEIAALRKTLPSSLFEAQWNQRPVQAGGNLFKMEWLRYLDEPLKRHEYEYVLQSWDTAVQTSDKNDYTVCATFGIRGKEAHLLDIYRDRIDHPDQLKKVAAMRATFSADLVIVEASHGGIAIHQHFIKSEGGQAYWIVNKTPRMPKIERAEFQTSKFEQGRIVLPRHAPWRASFEAELSAFPKAPHDDQVDAVTQLLGLLDTAQLAQALHRVQRFG